MSYTVVIRESAERRLQRIPEPLRSNIRHRIDRLADIRALLALSP